MSPEPGSIAHTLRGPAQRGQCVREQHNHDRARREEEMGERAERKYEGVPECAQIIFLGNPLNCNNIVTEVF